MKPRVAAAVLMVLLVGSWGQAQASGWLPPTMLFETRGRASNPVVVADAFGTVHILWEYGGSDDGEAPDQQAIYHQQLRGQQWLAPVDVLISQQAGQVTRSPSVAVDRNGYLHAVWSGGNAIYYSRAPAWEPPSAQVWSTPKTLSAQATSLEPSITVDSDGRICVVWTEAYRGLMYIDSSDGGFTWNEPTVIYAASSGNELARWGRIAIDAASRIHVVFTYTVEDESQRFGRVDANMLYYLRSLDGGQTWDEPRLMVPEPDFGQITVVTQGRDTVHLVWNGRAGRYGRYHSLSNDGGERWTEPDEVVAPKSPFGGEGLTGFPALATDVTGNLHLVSTGEAGDYYMRWSQGAWTAPVLISGDVDGLGVTEATKSLESPTIALAQDNTLHVVFHDGAERIWHTSAVIDAPARAPVSLNVTAEARPPATPTTSATAVPLPTPTPPAALALPPGAPPASDGSTLPIALGVLPAALLIVIVGFVNISRRRR